MGVISIIPLYALPLPFACRNAYHQTGTEVVKRVGSCLPVWSSSLDFANNYYEFFFSHESVTVSSL